MRCVLLLGVLGACTPYEPAYEWPVDARRDGIGVYPADAAVDAGAPADYQFLFQGWSPTERRPAIILGNVDGQALELRNTTVSLDPIVSPDGQSVAFVSALSTSQGQLVVRPLPGTDAEERTLATVSYDSTPVWSPDGRYIALESNVLVVIEVATGDLVRAIQLPLLGGAPSPCYRPSWSADGSEIAYADSRDVIAVVIATGATRTLTASTAPERKRCGARWSPDGQVVAYTSIMRDSSTAAIEVVPAAGGTPSELVRHDGFGLDPLRWSPDGRRIAYVARSADLGSELSIIDASGGTPTVLSTVAMSSLKAHTEWSRDGSMLLFAEQGMQAIAPDTQTVRAIPYEVVPIEGTMSWLVTPIRR